MDVGIRQEHHVTRREARLGPPTRRWSPAARVDEGFADTDWPQFQRTSTAGRSPLGNGTDDFFQRGLLQGGYALAFPSKPNTSFAATFAADEALAFDAGEGLWGECARR